MKENYIFINIASYRDPELIPTIEDAISNAKYPERLVFGICHQHSKDDKWDTLEKYENDERFRIIDMDYKDAKGVCYARAEIQKLWEDEMFTLQLDSHHRFIKHWDAELINTFIECVKAGYQKPLITSYIPSYDPENDPKGRVNEPWYLTFDRFAPEGPLHTRPHTIDNYKECSLPIPARFFSAHFAFTMGEFNREVLYDPSLYFHGEEITMAVRAYTNGYDLLSPHKVYAWHHYGRDFDKKHWGDHKNFNERDQLSFSRVRMLLSIGRAKCRPCQLRQLKPYAFGKERKFTDYERYAGIDFSSKKLQGYTLKHKTPPNPPPGDGEEWSQTLLNYQKFCVDLHRSHFKYDDYIFCVVSFEGEEPDDVIFREDLSKEEIERLLSETPSDSFVHIWKEFHGPMPTKVVIWPNSKKHGYVDRYEHRFNTV
tara:strand:+ start:4474 stop:5754 length:1281 start_codon:yes stop_codon:yes gene_type:complete